MAKKDPSKDAKFDTDMDSMLDRYDSGIGDFFEEDIKGADKDRGPVGRALHSISSNISKAGESIASGAAEGIHREINKSMPELGKTWDTAKEISNEAANIRDAVKEKVGPLWTETKRAMRTLGNKLSGQLPFGLDKKILALAGEEEQQERQLSVAEQRNQAISNNLNEIFKLQEQKSMEQQKDAMLNRLVDRRISAKHHQEESGLLSTIANQSLFHTNFTKNIFTAYMKKDLELKYKSFYVAADSLDVLKAGMSSIEKRLDAVVKNTALPDADKIYLTERVKGTMKQQLADRLGGGIQALISNVSKNIKEKLLGGVDMASMAISGLGMFGDMLQGEGEDSFGDDSMTIKGMIRSAIGSGIGAFGGQKLVKMIKDKLPKGALTHLTTALRGGGKEGLATLLAEAKRGRFGNSTDLPWIVRWLLEQVPDDLLGGSKVYNSTYNNIEAGGKVTNRTIATIEEIIPGYLRMQTKFLEMMATGKKEGEVEEQWYDFKTQGFMRAGTLKARYDKEIQEQFANSQSNAWSIRELYQNNVKAINDIFDDIGGENRGKHKAFFTALLNDKQQARELHQFLYNLAYHPSYRLLNERIVSQLLTPLYQSMLPDASEKLKAAVDDTETELGQFAQVVFNNIAKDKQPMVVAYWYSLLTKPDPDKPNVVSVNSNAINRINMVLAGIYNDGTEAKMAEILSRWNSLGHGQLMRQQYTSGVDGAGNAKLDNTKIAAMKGTVSDTDMEELTTELTKEQKELAKKLANATPEERAKILREEVIRQGTSNWVKGKLDWLKGTEVGKAAIEGFEKVAEGLTNFTTNSLGAIGEGVASVTIDLLAKAGIPGVVELKQLLTVNSKGEKLKDGEQRKLSEITEEQWMSWMMCSDNLVSFAQKINEQMKSGEHKTIVGTLVHFLPHACQKLIAIVGNDTGYKEIEDLKADYKKGLAAIDRIPKDKANRENEVKLKLSNINTKFVKKLIEAIKNIEARQAMTQSATYTKTFEDLGIKITEGKPGESNASGETSEANTTDEGTKFARGGNIRRRRGHSNLIDDIGGYVNKATSILGGAGIAGEAGGETIIPHKYNDRFKELVYKCVRDTVGEEAARKILRTLKPSKSLLKKLKITLGTGDMEKFAGGGFFSKMTSWFKGDKVASEAERDSEEIQTKTDYERKYGIEETNDILRNILVVNEAMYKRMGEGLMSVDILRFVNPKKYGKMLNKLQHSGFFGKVGDFVSSAYDTISTPTGVAVDLAGKMVTNSAGFFRHLLTNKICDVYKAPPNKGDKPKPEDILIRVNDFKRGVYKDAKCKKQINTVADLTIPAFTRDEDGTIRPIVDANMAPFGVCDIKGKPLVSTGGSIGRMLRRAINIPLSIIQPLRLAEKFGEAVKSIKRGLVDPYCDVYSLRDPHTRLVEGSDIKEGKIITVDPKTGKESVVKTVFDIKGICYKLVIDPEHPDKLKKSGEPVIKPEDIEAKLCDVNQDIIENSYLTKFGTYLRRVGGGVLSTMGSIVGGALEGATNLVGTAWKVTKAVVSGAWKLGIKAFTAKNPYIDVFVVRDGKQKCVILGDDLKNNKTTCRYIYKDNNEPVTSAYGIDREVISWFSEDGNTKLEQPRTVISEDDIRNGIFDSNGTKLTKFAGRSFAGKLASLGIGVAKFVGKKVLKFGMGVLRMGKNLINALGSVLGEGGAIVSGFLGNLWDQTVDLFKSSLISRQDLHEIVGQRLLDIYALLYTYMPRREGMDDKDGDGLLDNRYKEWKEGKEAARKAKEEKNNNKSDSKDDEKKPGFFSGLWSKLFGKKDGEGEQQAEGGGGDSIFKEAFDYWIRGKIFGNGGGGAAAGGKVGMLKRIGGWFGKMFGGKAAAGAAQTAAGAAAKGGLKGLAKGAWTKLGGFARNFGIKSLTKTVTKFGIKTLVKGAGIAGLAWLAADLGMAAYKLSKDDARMLRMRPIRCKAYGIDPKYWEAVIDLETDTFEAIQDGQAEGVDKKRIRQFGYKIDFINEGELASGGNKADFLKFWYTKRFLPAYTEYCSAVKAVRDHVAMQEAAKNGQKEVDFDKSQPKETDIPNEMFTEALNAIKDNLSKYSTGEYENYTPDIEHYKKWIGEIAEKAKEHGMGESIKYDNKDLRSDVAGLGDASSHLSYAWNELKHGNILNAGIAFDKAIVTGVAKTLINFFTPDSYVSQNQEIWEEIRYKLYGFDKNKCPRDEASRFIEVFREMEIDQIHYVDKEQPAPSKEELADWAKELFPEDTRTVLRNRLIMQGANEKELSSDLSGEIIGFFASWWRRVFLPVFSIYATVVRVACGDKPGDSVHPDNLDEDNRANALREFESQANRFLGDNKLDSDILKMSPDGFVRYMLIRCEGDKTEYAKDLQGLTREEEKTFDQRLSKELNEAGDDFSRAWRRFKNFQIGAGVGALVKGVGKGLWGIAKATGESIGAGLSEMFNSSINAGNWMDRFYDYGFPDVSGYTDWIEPTRVKVARAFETTVCESWLSGWQKPIVDGKFIQLLSSTELLDKVITAANIQPPSSSGNKTDLISDGFGGKVRGADFASKGARKNWWMLLGAGWGTMTFGEFKKRLSKVFYPEEMKLINELVEYMKFWYEIRMKPVATTFFEVATGYGMDAQPTFTNLDVDDIPVEKRAEALEAYKAAKNKTLTQTNKVYNLTVTGFNTYQEDKKRLTQENTEGKPKSEATAAIEGIQKQQKEAEGKAVADIITHVMPKLGAEESKNLAKMLEDTSEIDQAVADSTKMTAEAADAMLAKLGLQHFAGGKVATKTEQLSMAFCNAIMLNDMGALEGSQTTIGTLLNKAHAYFFGAVDSKATSDEEFRKMIEEFTEDAISGIHYENGKPVAGGGGIETTCQNLVDAQTYFGYTTLTNANITVIGNYSTYDRLFFGNTLSFKEMAKYQTMYYVYVASWFAKVFIPIYIYYVIAMNKMTGDKIGTKPNAGALNRMQIAQMIKLMNNARNKVKLGKYATLTMKHGCPSTHDLIEFFKQWLEQDKQAKEDNEAAKAERQAHYNAQAAAAKKQEEEAKQQEYQKQQDDASAKWQENLNKQIAEADAALVAAATGKQVDLSNEVGAINAGSGNTVSSALSSTAAKVNEQLQNQTNATKAASGATNKLNDKLRNAKAGEDSETKSTDISDRTDKSSTAAKKHITVTRKGGATRSRGGDSDKSTTPKSMPNKEQIARKIWKYFTSKGWSDEGVAGLLGNIEKESYVQCMIVQGDLHDPKFKKSIAYTEAADSAETEAEMKKCFIRDSKGYGLCQWTYYTRKRGLLNYARSLGKSVGDPDVQIAFLFEELEGGKNAIHILTKKGMLKKVKNATSVKEATDIILLYFEAPAAVQTYLNSHGKIDGGHTKELNERAGYAQYWFNKFHNAKLDGADDVPSSIAHHSAEEQVKPTNADGATKPTNVPSPKPNKQDASSGAVNETTGLPEVKAKPGGLKQQLVRTTAQEIKDAASVTEDDDSGVIIPTTASEAIKILKALPHLVGAKTSYGGKDWTSVSRLNPEFLKRLAVAGQLYEKAKSPKDWSITSAFRTYSEQAELKRKYPSSAAKAGTSRHETGIAIDLGDKNFGGIKGKKYDRGTSVDMLEPYLKMVGIIRKYRPNRLDEAQHFELAQSGRLPDLAQFAAKAARQSIDQLAQSTRAKLAPTDKDAIEEAKEAAALPGANDTGDTSVQEIVAGDGVPDHIPHGYAGGFIPDHIPQGGNVDFDTAAPTTTGNSYIDNVINTSSSMTSKYFNTAIDKLKSSPEMAAPSPVVNNAYVSDINAGTMGSTSTNVKTNSFTQADIDKERTTTPVVAELRLITEVVKSIYTLMRDTITKENTEEEKPATTTTTPKAASESFWDKVSPTDFAAMLTDAVKGLYPVSDVANGSKPRSTAPVHRAPMVYPLDTRKA